MSETKYIRFPFAIDGDVDIIPDATQLDGSLSWQQGWGQDYQRDLSKDENAKAIQRKNMNRLFNVVTAILKLYQERAFPEWISSEQNGGAAFAYGIGATVSYVDAQGKVTYWVSTKANNKSTPGNSGWAPYLYRVASDGEVKSKKGSYPITPDQARQIFESLLVFPEASTSKKGIVQLSNENYSESEKLAATPRAVSQKLDHAKTSLGSRNINQIKSFKDRGVYFQQEQQQATTENGYPETSPGVLLAFGTVNNYLVQNYISSTGKIWVRTVIEGKSSYGKWQEVGAMPPYATTQKAGIVKLTSSLSSKADDLAATAELVNKKLTHYQSTLGKDDNLNNLQSSDDWGVYYQGSNSRATEALNYPDKSAGVLQVLGAVNGSPVQIYTTYTGKLYIRAKKSGSEWLSWSEVGAKIPNAAVGSPGVVELSNEVNSKDENKAATPLAVSKKLTYHGNLDKRNLNDLSRPEDMGFWYQVTLVDATYERNYPISTSGLLECIGSINSHTMQRYSSWGGFMYVRAYSAEKGRWHPWRRIGVEPKNGDNALAPNEPEETP